jgi:hypothetical protein
VETPTHCQGWKFFVISVTNIVKQKTESQNYIFLAEEFSKNIFELITKNGV